MIVYLVSCAADEYQDRDDLIGICLTTTDANTAVVRHIRFNRRMRFPGLEAGWTPGPISWRPCKPDRSGTMFGSWLPNDVISLLEADTEYGLFYIEGYDVKETP
jgi:hypothetical protein